MAQFLLEILTPERSFFKEMVDVVVFQSFDGEVGVMAGHEKMVSVLVSGIVRIRQGSQWRNAASAEGYVMVYGDRVEMLVQSMEWPDEIDEERAENALHEAESQLKNEGLSLRDQVLFGAAQMRARARLHLLELFRAENQDKKKDSN